MILRSKGKPKLEWLPAATSTATTYGALGKMDGSGHVVNGNATSGDHVGIIMRAVVSTDADYAKVKKIPVDLLTPEDEIIADVVGTLTTALVGTRMDLDSTGANVNAAGTSKNVVTCVGFISATKGYFKVNAMQTTEGVAST